MSKFVKTAIAAAMVMGAFASNSAMAAGNNGTALFYGTLEDSVCSIVPNDHKLEVDMGDIGTGSLTGGKTTTPKKFQIHLQDCNFTTESTITTTFTGTPYSGNAENYSLKNRDNGTEISNVSLVNGNGSGKGFKMGEGIAQNVKKDSAGNGIAKQTLEFQAWLVGESSVAAVVPAPFESLTTFQITYL